MWFADSSIGAIPYRLQKNAVYELAKIAGFSFTDYERDYIEAATQEAQITYDRKHKKKKSKKQI